MRDITIDLNNLSFSHRDTLVHYSAPDMVVRRADPYIQIEQGGKTTILKNLIVKEPDDAFACRYKDQVLLIFGGQQLVLLNPDGSYEEIEVNYKPVVTDIHIHNNHIVFGNLIGKLFHFVIYDLEEKKRIYQTTSIAANTLSYYFGRRHIYTLMGNSNLVCWDYQGKEIWKKFEYQYVVPGLTEYNGKLLYSSNNQIKITDGNTTDVIDIPHVRIDKIEGVANNNLYGVCGERRNLFCFDLRQNNLRYEVQGDPKSIIRKLLLTRGKIPDKKAISNVLFFSTDTHLGMVDLERGHLQFYIGIPKIRSIVRNDEIIVSTHLGESHLLREAVKEESAIIEV